MPDDAKGFLSALRTLLTNPTVLFGGGLNPSTPEASGVVPDTANAPGRQTAGFGGPAYGGPTANLPRSPGAPGSEDALAKSLSKLSESLGNLTGEITSLRSALTHGGGGSGGAGLGGASLPGSSIPPLQFANTSHAPQRSASGAPVSSSGLMERIVNNVAWGGFSPGVIANAAVSGLPALPLAAIGVADFAVRSGFEATSAFMNPQYEASRQIAARRTAGNAMPSYEAQRLTNIGEAQGRLGLFNAAANPFESLPVAGGFIKGVSDLTWRKDYADRIAFEQAAVERDRTSALLRQRGYGGSAGMPTAAMGVVGGQILGSVGGGAAGFGVNFDYETALSRGYSAQDILGGMGTMRGMALSSRDRDLAGLLSGFTGDATPSTVIAGHHRDVGRGLVDTVTGVMAGGFNIGKSYSGVRELLGLNDTADKTVGGGQAFIRQEARRREIASAFASRAASRGDVDSIDAVRGLIGEDKYKANIAQASPIRDINASLEASGFRMAGYGADVSAMAASGAGYKQIQGGIGLIQNDLRFAATQEQALAAKSQSAQDRLEHLARAAQYSAQVQQQFKQGLDVEYGQRGSIIEGRIITAQTGISKGLTSGQSADDLKGVFGQFGASLRNRADLLEEQASRPQYAPQAGQMRAQAAQLRYQADVENERSRSNLALSQGLAGAGATQSLAGLQITSASLFGGGKDTGAAYGTAIKGFDEALAAVNARLKDSNLTLEERKRLEGQGNDLMRQRIEAESRAARAPSEMALGVAQGVASQVGSQVQREFIRGIGGVGGVNALGRNLDEANKMVAANKARMDATAADIRANNGRPEDNPEYQAQKAAYEQSLTQRESANASLASAPISLGLRREEAKLGFEQNVLQHTFVGYGNMRANYEGQLRNYGGQLRELDAMKKAAQAKGEWTEAMQGEYEGRKYDLGNRAVQAQQGLENGWMDRLISNVYNAPGSFAYVASQFTRKEASAWLQNINGSFGFTNADTRDAYMTRGTRLASTLVGNLTRPEGFMETAMANGRTPVMRGNDVMGLLAGHGGGAGGGEYDVHTTAMLDPGYRGQMSAERGSGETNGILRQIAGLMQQLVQKGGTGGGGSHTVVVKDEHGSALRNNSTFNHAIQNVPLIVNGQVNKNWGRSN